MGIPLRGHHLCKSFCFVFTYLFYFICVFVFIYFIFSFYFVFSTYIYIPFYFLYLPKFITVYYLLVLFSFCETQNCTIYRLNFILKKYEKSPKKRVKKKKKER